MDIDFSKKIHEQITPETWTQRAWFRLSTNEPISSYRTDTVCACLGGWLEARYCEPKLHGMVLRTVCLKVQEKGYEGIPEYNDAVTFDEVKQLLQVCDV